MVFRKGQSLCRKKAFGRNNRKQAIKAERKEKKAAEVKSIVVIAVVIGMVLVACER